MFQEIKPSDTRLVYCGRIDQDNLDAPVFVYPASFVRFRMSGKKGIAIIENQNNYYTNTLGVLVNDVYMGKIILNKEGITEADFSPFLKGEMAEVTLFKVQDGCHQYKLLGIRVDKNAMVEAGSALPTRRIEVYGDSISAGELSEWMDRVAMPDLPDHEGLPSNSYYSYSWFLARKLNASLHDIAQGGIALFDKEGWYNWPDFIGLESVYDKIEYQPMFGEPKTWDFHKYIPRLVVFAFGQNDANPENYMANEYEGEKAIRWRKKYAELILELEKHYPGAHFVCTTTILNHEEGWDKAIGQVVQELNKPNVHQFIYENNGKGTPGHVRAEEAYKMASELAAFVETLGLDW